MLKKLFVLVALVAIFAPDIALARGVPITVEAPADMTDEEMAAANERAVDSSSPVLYARRADSVEFPTILFFKGGGADQLTVYTDRVAFEEAIGSVVVEDFSSYPIGPDEFEVFENDDMSVLFTSTTGVFTNVSSTFWDNRNLVYTERPDNPALCFGCNGSGEFKFRDPEVSGFGATVLWAWNGPTAGEQWVATVELWDGSVEDVLVPHLFFEDPEFIGFTAIQPIRSVHLGGPNGSTWGDGELVIDEVTLADSGWIFVDGFESGDTSAWSAVVGE